MNETRQYRGRRCGLVRKGASLLRYHCDIRKVTYLLELKFSDLKNGVIVLTVLECI